MAIDVRQAVEILTAAEPDLVAAACRSEPEPLDLPTVFFAQLASEFCGAVPSLSRQRVAALLCHIESFLESGSDQLGDAVATGFWEAVLSESDRGSFRFAEIDSDVGPRSRTYCIEWDRFNGVRTPGLTIP